MVTLVQAGLVPTTGCRNNGHVTVTTIGDIHNGPRRQRFTAGPMIVDGCDCRPIAGCSGMVTSREGMQLLTPCTFRPRYVHRQCRPVWMICFIRRQANHRTRKRSILAAYQFRGQQYIH